MAIRTQDGIILTVGGKIAVHSDCCCDGTPTTCCCEDLPTTLYAHITLSSVSSPPPTCTNTGTVSFALTYQTTAVDGSRFWRGSGEFYSGGPTFQVAFVCNCTGDGIYNAGLCFDACDSGDMDTICPMDENWEANPDWGVVYDRSCTETNLYDYTSGAPYSSCESNCALDIAIKETA